MKMWSDVLTTNDLYAAANEARVTVASSSEIKRPRTRRRGWTVYLEGSSPYSAQATEGKAATWDEWGEWMMLLFDKDPDARIGNYDGRDDFMRQTAERIEAQERYVREFGGRRIVGMSAPWLKAVKV